MTLGELNYADNFMPWEYPFSTLVNVLFVIFVLAMPIILMNMLVRPWIFYFTNISFHYSTNLRDAHVWSESDCCPSSVQNRCPAIYVGFQDSSEIFQSAAQPQFFSLQICFVDNLLNNITIILLSLVTDFSQLGLRLRRLSIR